MAILSNRRAPNLSSSGLGHSECPSGERTGLTLLGSLAGSESVEGGTFAKLRERKDRRCVQENAERWTSIVYVGGRKLRASYRKRVWVIGKIVEVEDLRRKRIPPTSRFGSLAHPTLRNEQVGATNPHPTRRLDGPSQSTDLRLGVAVATQ